VLHFGSGVVPLLVFAAIMVVVIQGFNLFAAWLLQLIARSLAHLPSATGMWAARRVQADARTTWRRVSGLGLLSLIGSYIAVMPLSLNAGDDPTQQSFASAAQWDFTKGAIITLGVGFALTAMSIFIAQASAILERSEQTLALANMGASARFLTRVTWWETLAPLVLAIVLGAGLGLVLSFPLAQAASRQGLELWTGLPVMGIVLLAGIGLAIAALAACGPLQARVLATHERHND
ncbi:MAG: FtsX-like permease family protein, partial [Propionicimonas sp.]|nr:FtsX-like permease family protein [Propionicimonas sp.]